MAMIDPYVSAHYTGDCRKLLKQLPDQCVQTCITSPPYWGLRDYDTDGQIGLEPSPKQYVRELVRVFRAVRRVLKDDGTLWLNLGDCYARAAGGYNSSGSKGRTSTAVSAKTRASVVAHRGRKPPRGLKHKDLVGIPWEVAFALRDNGWYLRMDCIWAKPNPMPESVTDRPTKAHEYLFLLAKSERYYYDAQAIAEPLADKTFTTFGTTRGTKGNDPGGRVAADNWTRDVPVRNPKLTADGEIAGANKRSVWADESPERKHALIQAVRWAKYAETLLPTGDKSSVWSVAPQPYTGAHFAVYPPALIEPCVLSCSRPGDLVLDPFFGSGTTGEVAEKHERRWIGFDINPKYAKLAKERTAQRTLPLARTENRDG